MTQEFIYNKQNKRNQQAKKLMKNHLEIAIKAAIEAGIAILEIYESDDFEIEIKGDNSPLTKADLKSNDVITHFLEKTNIPVLSEEGKNIPYDIRKNWEELWIVDPIDGTKEFIKKNGEFTVNIALINKQRPIIGVIYVPVSKELYFSTIDSGSFKTTINNPKKINLEDIVKEAEQLPIDHHLESFTVVASRSHMSEETTDYVSKMEAKYGNVNLISKGSSLKICMVAEGKADCYPRFAPTMEWDTAAGQAIAEHAGFDFIDWETKQTMLYNRENLLNNWFLVKKPIKN